MGIDIELKCFRRFLPSEHNKRCEYYGATVILTPAKEGTIGSRDYADKVAEGGYIVKSVYNEALKVHYKTTGPGKFEHNRNSTTRSQQ
jgi:cysteine synthase B